MSGFVTGSLWGLVLGGVGLVFISQINEQPAGNEPPATPQLIAPETAQADAMPDGLTGTTPEVAREFAEAAPRVTAPEVEVQAPQTDTTPAAPPLAPEIETVLTLPEDVSNPEISAGMEEPLITRTVTSSPTVPQPEEDVLIATQPFQIVPNAAVPDDNEVAGVAEDAAIVPDTTEVETETVVAEENAVAAPEVAPEPLTEVPTVETAETTVVETPEVEPADTPVATLVPEAEEAPVEEAPVTDAPLDVAQAPLEQPAATEEPPADAPAPTPQTVTTDIVELPQVAPVAPEIEAEADAEVTAEAEASPATVTEPSLPQVGSGVRVNRPGATPSETAGAEAEVTPDQAVSDNVIALERYAAAFESPADLPLMSIVLLDSADDPGMVQSVASLPFATTVVIDALSQDATARMQAYREAGVEVALQTVLPQGAMPTDVEVAFEAAFDILPETVALFSGQNGIVQSNRAVSDQVIEVLQAEGRGLVVVERGFGSAIRQAEQAGLPAISVERDLDGAGETASSIARALDQAAFRARQSGNTVLLARAMSETITVLSTWSTENDGAQIALAPVSAILSAQQPTE